MTLRLFVQDPLAPASEFVLPASAGRHVQVRRLQPGDALCLFDGRGGEWDAQVLAMGRRDVVVQVLRHRAVERELRQRVTLAVGMPANERMDWLVEKATELGVARIAPLLCERSVLRLDGERAERRREHWQGVAVAAAEQCGRTRVPRIDAVQPLRNLLAAPVDKSWRWLLSLQGSPLAGMPATPDELIVLSGPEGGLSADEEQAARAAGFTPVAIGPRVLRAETAPLALLSWLALGGLESVKT